MVKCLTHGLRGFYGAVQGRLATLTVTMLISSRWQLSSEVELRRIFDVCKRWANSGSHEFVKKNMVRYMRPHGRFSHCSCKNAVRQPPVLASCVELYDSYIFVIIITRRSFSSLKYIYHSKKPSNFFRQKKVLPPSRVNTIGTSKWILITMENYWHLSS